MSTNSTGDRVRRALSADELAHIHEEITAADNTTDLLMRVFRAVFTPLLADLGATLDDISEDNKLRTGQYAVPTSQWQAIVTAITDRAAAWGTAALLTFDLIELMPASYDDPETPAPVWHRVDRRPHTLQLAVSREAIDVIGACEARLQALAEHYGREGRIYLDALHSWHHHAVGLFSMAFGADTRITRDGDLSLFASTGSGFVYAVIFHGQRRHCTADGCHTMIGDDGIAYPSHRDAPVLDHDHTPSYPVGWPQPGTWSSHS